MPVSALQINENCAQNNIFLIRVYFSLIEIQTCSILGTCVFGEPKETLCLEIFVKLICFIFLFSVCNVMLSVF